MIKINEQQKKAADNSIEMNNKRKTAVLTEYSKKGYQKNVKSENIENCLKKKTIKKNIVSENEVLTYLSNVITGKEEEASVKDKLKAAELLGKKYGTYTDKLKIDDAIPVIIKDDVNE